RLAKAAPQLLSVLLAGAWAAAPTLNATANERNATIDLGHRAFLEHCDACHGREQIGSDGGMQPATASLAIAYQGTRTPATLEDRTDLSATYVKYIVRHGDHGMPFFRKTMVSDVELEAIAAYLSRNNTR
ncbi:MAG TPA: cytochrome c, partial [Steroidobacteraceae bacterium]|nr:cytochrome c [Steroidobacteraceae bacterium]